MEKATNKSILEELENPLETYDMSVDEAGYDELVVVQDKDLVQRKIAQKSVELSRGDISFHSNNDAEGIYKEKTTPNVLNLSERQGVDNRPVKDFVDG